MGQQADITDVIDKTNTANKTEITDKDYVTFVTTVTQWFETYNKVKYCTSAVVISLHCKHNMFYISM